MQEQDFNWDDLRIFLAVARHRTLAAAGNRLQIDPTTVARRIARLEKAVSQTLFEHTNTGHSLTSRGQELLAHAQQMESAALTAASGSPGAAHSAEGVVRLSVSEGFGHWVITPHLHEFVARYPGIAVELVASSGFLNPSRREADLSIMLARPKKGPLVVRKLTDYRLGLYAAAGGRAAAIEHPSDLQGERFVGYVPDLIYAPELRYLDEVAPGLEAGLSSTSITAQAILIENGAGIGILPCFIGDKNPRLTRLLAGGIDIERSFWLVMHRDVQQIARIRLFIDWLVETVGAERSLAGLPA